MNAPVEVLVHEISTQGANDNVAEILSILGRPLPLQNLSTAKILPTFPPDFKQRIDAICSTLASVDPEVGGKLERPEGTRPVTDVLDVILTSVLLLRASRQCSHGFTERKSNWVSMLSACGLAMSENVVCCDDIDFARARTRSNADVLNLRDFERKATIAMSVALPRPPRHFPNNDIPDSTADEDSGSTSDASHDSFATMDLPFDAHISPARGKRVDCTLPVVFAARSQEMHELMTSLVCQRRVLGISTPVVGLSLPEEGTYASLVLGWADDSSPTIVHIAFPPSPLNAPGSESLPLGVFDGSNPVSTLRLAQFVLDLEPYFASVKAHALNPQVHDFCWRLDHAHFDHSHIWNSKSDKAPPPHNDTSRITAWQTTLQLADTPDPHPPFALNTSKHSEDVFAAFPLPKSGTPPSPQVLGTLTNMTRSTRSSTRQSSTTNPTSPTDSLHPSTAERSRPASPSDTASDGGESNTGVSDVGSAKSDGASNFAKIFDPDDPRGLGRWTRERETILLFLVPLLTETTEVDHQINCMIKFYEEVTKFVWIEDWATLDKLPPCDPSLGYIREALFTSYEQYQGPKVLINSEDPTCLTITTRLSGLLNVVATAAASALNVKNVEAGTRGAWDQSIRLLSCDADTAVSDSYMVEKTIPLPVNRAVRQKQNFKAQQLAQVMQIICLNQSFSASINEDIPPAVVQLTAQANAYASAFVSTVQAYIAVGHYVKEGERQNEPVKATADGIYYLRYNPNSVAQSKTTLPKQRPSKSRQTLFPTGSQVEAKPPVISPSPPAGGFVSAVRSVLRIGSGTPSACAERSRLRALTGLTKPKKKAGKKKKTGEQEKSSEQQKAGEQEKASEQEEEEQWQVVPEVKPKSPPLEIPHISCFTCTSVTRSLQVDKRLVIPTVPDPYPADECVIPFVYVEYKRDGSAIHQAFNQIKMYCTSGLEHLASIGITDFPVWGIVCGGNEGVIIMAWKSTKSAKSKTIVNYEHQNHNFILDGNVKRFNLDDPLQAFHFFTTVHRIYLQKDNLAKRLKGRSVAAFLKDPERQAWQMPKRPRAPKTPKSPTPTPC